MTRVLVTGAGGFVGSHVLAHTLDSTDWEITATDSFRHHGKTDRIWQILADREPEFGRVHVFRHDLGAPISEQMIGEIGPIDYVIALASESHVERSITHPVPFVENNVALALNTLEFARVVKPKSLIWISTDEVYGPAPSERDHPEWDPIIPSNPYAASKAAQEAICTAYWRTYGVPVVLVNIMNMFGTMQDAEKFVPLVIKRVLAGETVQIHGKADEIGSRYYLPALNTADAFLWLLANHEPLSFAAGAGRPSRFNVVGDREVDNLEMAQLVAKFTNRPLYYEFVGATRPGHDLRYGLDGSKIDNLGWIPPFDFEDSLEHTVRWTVDHTEWLK